MEGNDPSARKFSTVRFAHLFPTFALHELPPGMQASLHNVLHQTLLYNARDVFEEFCCQSGLRREASSRFLLSYLKYRFAKPFILYMTVCPLQESLNRTRESEAHCITPLFTPLWIPGFPAWILWLGRPRPLTVYIGLPCDGV